MLTPKEHPLGQGYYKSGGEVKDLVHDSYEQNR